MVPVGRDERLITVQALTVYFSLVDVALLVASSSFAICARPNRGHDFESRHSWQIPPIDFADELVLEFGEVITEAARVVHTDLRAQL